MTTIPTKVVLATRLASLQESLYQSLKFCGFAAHQTQQDRDFDTEDARLNAAYQALIASLDDVKKKALRNEERAWIRGADKTCAAGKNYCRRIPTANRADELERRMGGLISISGEWGYRTDCGFGRDVELFVPKPPGDIMGTWADGTGLKGSQGDFNGEWRDGRLYVRFCERDSMSMKRPGFHGGSCL